MNQRNQETWVLTNAVNHARDFVSRVVCQGDYVVDATAGNGYDTLFLAELVGETGKVYAFDIQQTAIDATRKRLTQHKVADLVELVCAGHEELQNFVQKPIRAVMFNLGYLPGFPKGPVTHFDSVKEAILQSLDLLLIGGLISLAIYPGHDAGREELRLLLEWVPTLDQKHFSVAHLKFLNQQNFPPELLLIEKK